MNHRMLTQVAGLTAANWDWWMGAQAIRFWNHRIQSDVVRLITPQTVRSAGVRDFGRGIG